jgi:hypothetical protein
VPIMWLPSSGGLEKPDLIDSSSTWRTGIWELRI